MNNDFPFDQFLKINEKPINYNNIDLNNEPLRSAPQAQILSENFDNNEMEMIKSEILINLEKNVNPHKYETFFRNKFNLVGINQKTLIFTVPTDFIKKMIESSYIDDIKACIFNALGESYGVIINTNTSTDSAHMENSLIGSGLKKDVKSLSFRLDEEPITSTGELNDQIQNQVSKSLNNTHLRKVDPNKTFENFVIGPSNNIANAFTVAVAKDPGKVYPCLYLYGKSGLGKTHLLHAICNYIKKDKPHLRISMTSSSAFTTEMINSIQSKQAEEFKRRYTELTDVLIIDDIHELKNKNTTQNVFFHIFNELQSKGKQLIFTSDKEPKEIDGIEERIKTRLSQALHAEIQQPDFETRIAILKQKAEEKDIYLDDDVVNLIASCIKDNVRELEGSLIKLGAYSSLCKVDIDLEIAKEQLRLGDLIDQKTTTLEGIAKSVATYFKITVSDLKGKSRVKEITKARHIAMYMSHKILKSTLETIGNFYGKRDHTSVLYAIKNVKINYKDDSQLNKQIYEIESSL